MSSPNEHTHATEGNLHAADHHDAPHAMSWQLLVGVWLALMVLTMVTVGAAYLPLTSDFWRAGIAIAIATVKATLVALFFMHLFFDEKFNLVILIATILFVVIFFAFTMMDPLSRGWVNPISEFPIDAKMDRPGSMIERFHPDSFNPAAAADAATTASAEAAGADHGSAPAH